MKRMKLLNFLLTIDLGALAACCYTGTLGVEPVLNKSTDECRVHSGLSEMVNILLDRNG